MRRRDFLLKAGSGLGALALSTFLHAEEGRPVHRAVKDPGRGDALKPECPHEGRRLPVPMRHAGPASLSARRPAAQPGHLGRGAGLVDKDQARGIEVRLRVEPGVPPGQDVGPILFAGVCRFF